MVNQACSEPTSSGSIRPINLSGKKVCVKMVSAALGASDQGVWGVYTLQSVRQLWCGRCEVTTLKVEEEGVEEM
jgi:hypothetical protein